MSARSSGFLGLSIGDQSIACAEAVSSGSADTGQTTRTAEFELPAELSAQTAEASGRALGSFLRARGFTAARAVVGVPARWLIAHERELPPSDEQSARAILRLAAERLKSGDGSELVFDYAGRSESASPSRVLIIGMLRRRLTDVRTLAEAAGLSIVSVSVASLMVAAEEQTTLVLSRQGAELICIDALSPRLIRPLSVGALNGHGIESIVPLAAEMRRSLVMSPAVGATAVSLIDGMGLSDAQLTDLSERLGKPVTRSGKGPAAAPFAAAAALAWAGVRRTAMPVDFLNSRLAERPAPRISRQTLWGILAATVLIVGLGALWYDTRRKETDAADLQGRMLAIAPDLKAALENIARVDYARGYFDRRPPMMECLREVTMAFRGDDTIWATSILARDNRKAQLVGKATNQRAVVALLDRLKHNTKLTDVKLAGLHEEGRTRDVTFSLSFDFASLD